MNDELSADNLFPQGRELFLTNNSEKIPQTWYCTALWMTVPLHPHLD
jgi:hypothetical protein